MDTASAQSACLQIWLLLPVLPWVSCLKSWMGCGVGGLLPARISLATKPGSLQQLSDRHYRVYLSDCMCFSGWQTMWFGLFHLKNRRFRQLPFHIVLKSFFVSNKINGTYILFVFYPLFLPNFVISNCDLVLTLQLLNGLRRGKGPVMRPPKHDSPNRAS
jgi:hypothetical protein